MVQRVSTQLLTISTVTLKNLEFDFLHSDLLSLSVLCPQTHLSLSPFSSPSPPLQEEKAKDCDLAHETIVNESVMSESWP